MYYVYELANNLNGKRYFGHTNVNPYSFTFEELLDFADENSFLAHLYNSMKKYGKDAFKITIVDHCSSEAEAKDSLELRVDFCKTEMPSKGYNYKGAELIPCQTITEKEPTTVAEEKDPVDVISVATKSLFVLRNCIRTKNFEKFFSEYVYFNSIIPITGVYDHFGLAIDGMMVTLFEICRDCLSVYIKEHLNVR